MGAAVRGVIAEGGYSLGIAPKFFDKPGILQKDCSEFLYPETMRERKQLMEDHADAFIVLPGGIGTFEEFFEILTLKQLGRMNKPIMLFNLNGYYDPLLRLLEETIAQGFMKPACRRLYAAFDDSEAMLAAIQKELGRAPRSHRSEKYLTTSPAIISPAAEGTKLMLAGVRMPVLTGSSSE